MSDEIWVWSDRIEDKFVEVFAEKKPQIVDLLRDIFDVMIRTFHQYIVSSVTPGITEYLVA